MIEKSLSIAYIHVDDTGLKSTAFRYCISSGSDEFLCELLIFSLCDFICDSLSCAESGIFHNPLLLSPGPWTIIWPLSLIFTFCALN